MTKNCKLCGQPFVTYPSKIKLGRGKYCSRDCSNMVTLVKKGQHLSLSTEIRKGQRLRYNGYRYTRARKDGRRYKELHMPEHPNATKAGYIREHRYIVEQSLGRLLESSEIVHHKDGNPLNNMPSNLVVMNKRKHDQMNVNLNIHKRWQG